MTSDNSFGAGVRKLGSAVTSALGLSDPSATGGPLVAATSPVSITPTSGGSVQDLAGNTYTLTVDGMMEENGRAVPGGGGTSEVTYVSGVLWALSASTGEWYTFIMGYWYPQGVATPVFKPPPLKIPPSQVTNVHTTAVTPTTISLAWTAPRTGTPPIGYTAFVRLHKGPLGWAVGATSSTPAAVITGLRSGTEYDIEIMAHNT